MGLRPLAGPRLTPLPAPGALHGQPHAPAEEHHALEGGCPGPGGAVGEGPGGRAAVPGLEEGRSRREDGLQAIPTPTRPPLQRKEVGQHWGPSPAAWRPRSVPGRCPGGWPRHTQGLRGCTCLAPGLTWPLSQTPPQIRPFHQDDFLCSLEHAGPQLTCILKGDWLGLYRWVDTSGGPEAPAAVGAGFPCPPSGTRSQPHPHPRHCLSSPTGSFSSPPTLTAGTGSGAKRWPASWRPCTWRPSVRR